MDPDQCCSSKLISSNFEDVIDSETHNICDTELNEALCALLNLPHHTVKAILTIRIAPRDLVLTQPSRQIRLELDKGLESPYAENILRQMDLDGKVGLKLAPDHVLYEAGKRTLGYPRALEALFAILSADRHTTLHEVLNDAEELLPENVVEVLVGEAFNRLDPTAEKVMEALAVLACPVIPAAVDHLLEPYWPGVNSAPVLNRLVNMHFVRKESGRYYLHPVDRVYAFERVPRGETSDRSVRDTPPFTQFALLHRGAEYFKQARKPREHWKMIEDLTPQLTEFDLRFAGEDYDAAASVLLEIGFNYLYLWGHYKLLIDLHERLQRKLNDPYLKQNSAGILGSAHYCKGSIEKAIGCYEQALALARETKDRSDDGTWLGRLGNCYSDLGQTAHAIDHYERALAIARDAGDRFHEAGWLGNLGNFYLDLGQTTRAIDYYKQALAITREIEDRAHEGLWLGNLGNGYACQGHTTCATRYCEQALVIAREIGNRSIEIC
jgi:tetratricopeptide (TPR) repeat protein